MQQTHYICIYIRKLWFTNAMTQIVEQDCILWINAIMWCKVER